MYDQAAYNTFCEEAKQIAAGRRGWMSITAHSRTTGLPKAQLEVVCKALGLEIERSHGKYGTVASRPRQPN